MHIFRVLLEDTVFQVPHRSIIDDVDGCLGEHVLAAVFESGMDHESPVQWLDLVRWGSQQKDWLSQEG
jgi:hypothetical protein